MGGDSGRAVGMGPNRSFLLAQGEDSKCGHRGCLLVGLWTLSAGEGPLWDLGISLSKLCNTRWVQKMGQYGSIW